MKLVGSVDLGSHNRITIPPKALELVKFKPGEVLLLYEDRGTLIIKRAPGED